MFSLKNISSEVWRLIQKSPPQSSLLRLPYCFTSTRNYYQQHSSSYHNPNQRYGTTILCIRKEDKVVLAGDGQVTQNNVCIKPNARKLRRLANGKVITGFAGTTADAFTLLERLEGKLDEHPGQLLRACVELAKMWRTDRYLKNLEAVMVVADENLSLEVTGNGDVLESHDGIIGVGSGGSYAVAAARALYENTNMDARTLAESAMKIAADLCIYTNHCLIFEELASISRPNSQTPSSSHPPALPSTSQPTDASNNTTIPKLELTKKTISDS